MPGLTEMALQDWMGLVLIVFVLASFATAMRMYGRTGVAP